MPAHIASTQGRNKTEKRTPIGPYVAVDPDVVSAQTIKRQVKRREPGNLPPSSGSSWWMTAKREDFTARALTSLSPESVTDYAKGEPKTRAPKLKLTPKTHCGCGKELTAAQQTKGFVRCGKCRKAQPGRPPSRVNGLR